MSATFDDYPEVSFIDNMTLADAIDQIKTWYEEKYKEITGEERTLADGDVEKIRLDAIGYMYYQALQYIDKTGKQNLLKYAAKAMLDNMAARVGIKRHPAEGAEVTIRFTLSKAQTDTYIIPAGTRCTAGDDVFFEAIEAADIAAGETQKDVACVCTTAGEAGNNYEIGEISTLVDTLPYIQSVENTTKPMGGKDEETDEELAERIYLVPSTYSTAGVEDSYIYMVRQADSRIGDIYAWSPSPCEVEILFIMEDGSIPDEDMTGYVLEYLCEPERKVLGDHLTVKAPETVSYNVELSYYVGETDRRDAEGIKKRVEAAVADFKKWQTEKIGRDINPSRLAHMVMTAGAKRVEVTSPAYQSVESGQIAQEGSRQVTFGGIEND